MGQQGHQKKKKNKKKLTKKLHQPNGQSINTTPSDEFLLHFKPSSQVQGLNFGVQLVTKSFTVRRATSPLPLDLLSINTPDHSFYTITSYVPTNFTILAHRAWHTLTLGLGTQRSKVLIFVFDSLALNRSITGAWPSVVALGDVKREMIRGSHGCEMARFKVRKGCITFYVYAVRRVAAAGGFAAGEELRLVLTRLGEMNDFLDHTAMLALPKQKTIHHYYDQSMMAVSR